jgi:hypothetical protein
MFNRKLKEEIEELYRLYSVLTVKYEAVNSELNVLKKLFREERDNKAFEERVLNTSKRLALVPEITLKAKVEHLEEDIIRLEQYLDIELKHTPESRVYVKRENSKEEAAFKFNEVSKPTPFKEPSDGAVCIVNIPVMVAFEKSNKIVIDHDYPESDHVEYGEGFIMHILDKDKVYHGEKIEQFIGNSTKL